MSERYHYWLYCVDSDSGKPYLIYGGPASHGEDAARQRGLEMLGGQDFKIKRLPTRDISAASAFIRGKRLESSHSLKAAGTRLGHDRSVKRHLQHRQWTNAW